MKKVVWGLLCVVLAAALLAGCSTQKEEPTPSPSPSPQAEERETYTIGLVQYEDHAALNTLRESFMARLDEWGCGEDQLEIDYRNAQGDEETAQKICQEFVSRPVDMIVAIATPAAQAALSAAQGTHVTVVFAGVGDTESLDLEGNQATGVVSPTPVSQLIDLALQADPQLKTLGLLYDPDDPGAQEEIQAAKEACGEKGLEVAENTVSSEDQVVQAMTDLCGRVDAVFSPVDNTVAPKAAEAAEAAKIAQVPWYASGGDALVQAGALASMGVTSREVGQKTADMAVRLLVGDPLEEVPVYTFGQATTFVNQTTLNALPTLTFPGEALQNAYVYE